MRKRVAVTGLAAVLALGVAGCGGGDASLDATAPTTTADVPAGGEESPTPATELDFCTLLTADQVGAAVGGTVTLEKGPLDLCEFSQDDPRAISGTLGVTEVGPGGYDAYRTGSAAVGFDDPAEQPADIDGTGFVVTGTIAGGSNIQAAAGAEHGDVVLTVNLTQGHGLSESAMVGAASALLALLLEASG